MELEKTPRPSVKVLDRLLAVLAIVMTGVQLWTYTFGLLPAMEQRSLFLGFTLALLLLMDLRDGLKRDKLDLWSIFLLAGSLIACAYTFLCWNAMSLRLIAPEKLDIVMGILILAAIIKCTNRRLGIALPLIMLVFVFYALLGSYLPGEMGTGYFTVQRLVAHLTMSTSGVFGTVLGTAAKYIFVFIIFGAFLSHSGASAFFLELTDRLLGGTKGSGAKVGVFSSALFGTISGSAVANVMATGPMTIPMMRKNGMSGMFAGAVTSIAGTGGQLMPPVMGTTAFIIAETIAVGYGAVTKSALIPGLLFYLTLWVAINFHSNHLGLAGTKERKDWRPMLKSSFFYVTPIVFLILAISVLRWSPIKAGLWSTVLVVVLSQFNPRDRMGLKKILKAMEEAAYDSLTVSAACATAGVIIGILSLTGLGLKFSGLLVALSGGHLMLLLVLTMAAGLILGMGMTTTSVYIVLSVLVAPALISFGISPMAAHLFVFYFGILSCITPPVATAVYSAASIAGESPMKLGWYTTKIAAPIYLLPFMFVLNPELLMLEGNIFQILLQFTMAAIGLAAIAAALEGCFRTRLSVPLRIVLGLCSLSLLERSVPISLGCTALILLIFIHNFIRSKRVSTTSG